MKKRPGLLALAAISCAALCLFSVQAAAAPAESPLPQATAQPETTAQPEVTVQPEVSAAPQEEAEPVTNPEGERMYAQAGSTVYNNGGTVYNNGATVYNNGGLVYNNAGTVYNNGGTVYANGGVVYNNDGDLHDNGATVYSNQGSVESTLPEGAIRVETAADYSGFCTLEGLETGADGGFVLSKDGSAVIKALNGYEILSAEASSGLLQKQEDGSWLLSQAEEDLVLSLEISLIPPVLSLESGSYPQPQSLEISAGPGAKIYYSTDGSEPGTESIEYDGPVSLSQGLEIKAVAIAQGLEPSGTVQASYALVAVEWPDLGQVQEGYVQPEAQPITVKNSGTVDASIKSVIVSGDDVNCFILSRTAGDRVPAGTEDSQRWTICPKTGLAPGQYIAHVCINLDSGQTLEADLSFDVSPKA